MEVPVYDPKKETLNQYIERVSQFNNYLKEDNYNLILEFFNKWLNASHSSLLDFKLIDEELFFEKPKKNRKLLREYCPIFKDKVGIDTDINKKTDKLKISANMIHRISIKLLNNIKYKFVKNERNNKVYYTIRSQ
jgi:hypothetical protein